MANQVALPAEPAATSGSLRRRIGWFLCGLSILLFIGSITLYVFTLLKPAAASSPLQLVSDISLAGGTPSFDQQAIDPTTGRLFLAHSGGSEVIVFDTHSQKIVGRITGIKKNHGIVVLPNLHRVYVSATFDNMVYVIDEQSLHILSKIPVGQKPDMIAYDPQDQRLFISNELGLSDSVIDIKTNQVIATVPVGGEAGNTRYDSALHLVFTSVQTKNQVIAIDPVSLHIVNTGTLPTTCNHNHGLILDVAQNRGFVSCDLSATLYEIDLHTFQTLATQKVAPDPDLMAFDDGRNLLYVSTHTGVLSIFDDKAGGLKKVYEQCVASNAHTVFVDPNTHLTYMPLVSMANDVCPVQPQTPKSTATTTTAKVTPTPAPINGQQVLRISLFHYGNI